MSLRLEMLKGYILCVASESREQRLSVSNILTSVATDVPKALAEMLGQVTPSIADKIEGFAKNLPGIVGEKARQLVADVRERGLQAVWRDVMVQYERGVDVNASRR